MGINGLITGLAGGLGAYDQGKRDADEYTKKARRQAILDSIEEFRLDQMKNPRPKVPEPYTLNAGDTRYGADNKLIATAPAKVDLNAIPEEQWNAFAADKPQFKNLPVSRRGKAVEDWLSAQLRPATAEHMPLVTDKTGHRVADRPGVEVALPGQGPTQPSASEQKAGAFYETALSANKNLEGVSAPSLFESTAGKMGGNALLSGQRQKWNQAASQFTDAVLRFASGANLPVGEIKNKIQELLPIWGDRPEVIQQKAEQRVIYLQSLKEAAGRAQQSIGGGNGGPPNLARDAARAALMRQQGR